MKNYGGKKSCPNKLLISNTYIFSKSCPSCNAKYECKTDNPDGYHRQLYI